jgi:ATP-binding cassette subfamily F protein 3
LVRIEDLAKSYGARMLFDGVTFNIDQRERIGIVGRNGHGKTTLLRLLLGEEEPDRGAIAFPRGYRVGHLSQHLAFSRPTLEEEACLGLPEGEREEGWRARKVLAGLGFAPADLARPPASFSGGFAMRLALAKALVSRPDLLLLDEPTNFLDIVAVRWLTRFLLAWPGELAFVTHDRAFMDRVATHVAGIHRGRVRKMAGDTGKYYAQLAADEVVVGRSRVRDERKRRDAELFIRRFRAKARLAGMVQSRIKMLEKQETPDALEYIPRLAFSFRAQPFAARTLLSAEDLCFSWGEEAPPLISGLTLAVGRGERIGVVGPNGRGKSTLLRLLAGELAPRAGEVRRHRALRAGYHGQTNVDRLSPARTVLEELLESDPERSPQRARDVAGTMMFPGDDAGKRIAVLSGGERSSVLLGRLLLAPANLLLLDEPTSHLDMESGEALLAALGEFPGAVVMVTHDERFLHRLAQRLVVFDGGRVLLFDGTYRRFLDEVGWESERGFDMPTPAGGGLGPVEEGAREGAAPGKAKPGKRGRAELVQARSRVLRPLEAEVERLEGEVAEAERRCAAVEQDLLAASARGAGGAIAALARRRKEEAALRERLYVDLFAAAEGLEAARREWEEKARLRDILRPSRIHPWTQGGKEPL